MAQETLAVREVTLKIVRLSGELGGSKNKIDLRIYQCALLCH